MNTNNSDASSSAGLDASDSNIEIDLYLDLMSFIDETSQVDRPSVGLGADLTDFDLDWSFEAGELSSNLTLIACPNCGSRSANQDLFCIECGAFLDQP
jgi:hypothetical protein